MNINNNVLKEYLKNCYFITGTAYAGKSTACAMLAEKYGLIHCRENYGTEGKDHLITQEDQPNLNYFNTMPSWQHFVSRSPEDYEKWMFGTSREVADFEVAELIRITADRKAIVDTNIPLDILKEISDYDHIAIMLSPQAMSVEEFFNRGDEEKQFLLSVINSCPDPEATLENFKAGIARINSPEHYNEFLNSGLFTLIREDAEKDTREEVCRKLAEHFGFE